MIVLLKSTTSYHIPSVVRLFIQYDYFVKIGYTFNLTQTKSIPRRQLFHLIKGKIHQLFLAKLKPYIEILERRVNITKNKSNLYITI